MVVGCIAGGGTSDLHCWKYILMAVARVSVERTRALNRVLCGECSGSSSDRAVGRLGSVPGSSRLVLRSPWASPFPEPGKFGYSIKCAHTLNEEDMLPRKRARDGRKRVSTELIPFRQLRTPRRYDLEGPLPTILARDENQTASPRSGR